MAFILKSGRTKNIWLPVTTSTALPADSMVTFTSGLLVAATSATTAANIAGVLVRPIAATDLDYATARLVAVQVPLEKSTVWEADVTSGLVATDIGAYADLTDNLNVNRAASAIKAVRVVGVTSTIKGLFHISVNGAF